MQNRFITTFKKKQIIGLITLSNGLEILPKLKEFKIILEENNNVGSIILDNGLHQDLLHLKREKNPWKLWKRLLCLKKLNLIQINNKTQNSKTYKLILLNSLIHHNLLDLKRKQSQ